MSIPVRIGQEGGCTASLSNPEGAFMKTGINRRLEVVAIAIAACLAGAVAILDAQQRSATGVTIGATDLGGVVTGPNGPEAGVWVIAETKDLPTKFARVVVTDDRG